MGQGRQLSEHAEVRRAGPVAHDATVGRRHVLGDDAAGTYIGAIADTDRRHQRRTGRGALAQASATAGAGAGVDTGFAIRMTGSLTIVVVIEPFVVAVPRRVNSPPVTA